MKKIIEYDHHNELTRCCPFWSGHVLASHNLKGVVIMHSSLFIANRFIGLANDQGVELTHMQVQKLVYFAHAISLASDGRPFISDQFFAYPFGPIEKNLYNALRKHGRSPVQTIPSAPADVLDQNEEIVIAAVFRRMGRLSGYELSRRSHAPDGPWDFTWNHIGEFAPIDNARIREFYSE